MLILNDLIEELLEEEYDFSYVVHFLDAVNEIDDRTTFDNYVDAWKHVRFILSFYNQEEAWDQCEWYWEWEGCSIEISKVIGKVT